MKQKTVVLYVGRSHKGFRPFVATCANGVNIAGKTFMKVDFSKRSASKLENDARRFRWFAERCSELALRKRNAA